MPVKFCRRSGPTKIVAVVGFGIEDRDNRLSDLHLASLLSIPTKIKSKVA